MDLQSHKWGKLNVYPERNYVTVYLKTADHLYHFFDKGKNGNPPEPINWGTFILGARSTRFDFEIPDWDELTDEGKTEVLDALIQKAYDDDDLFGFHVEEIHYDIPDFSKHSDNELFEQIDELSAEELTMERELRRTRLVLKAVGTELGKRDINW